MIKRSRAYIGFIMPGLCVYTLFMIVPLFAAVYYSLFKWAGVGEMTFVGLENFRRIFLDPRMSKTFFNALGNNLKYMLIAVFVFIPIQTLMAYLIHIRIRGHKVFKLLVFLPYVISSSIIGFFSLLVFDPNIGMMNKLFKAVGLPSLVSAWFGDPGKAFPLLVTIIGWQGIGVGMAIILANMKGIPNEVIEAGIIDGAGAWSRFWNIELPFLKPSLVNVTVLSSIFALTQFDLPFIIGGAIGGIDGKTDFLNLVFYRHTFGGAYLGETNIGFGASISVVLFLIILLIAVLQNFGMKKIFKKRDSGE
jgi:raffinose/stachyose/melibiose transport system permease protein